MKTIKRLAGFTLVLVQLLSSFSFIDASADNSYELLIGGKPAEYVINI